MKFPLIAILLLAAIPAFAQKQNVYFIKKDGTYITNRDSAEYIRIVREPDSASTLYNVLEFYPNGTRKLIGKSSRINPPDYQGICISYYANGTKKLVENYKDNMLAGMQYEYFPNGKLYAAKKYAELTPAQYAERVDDFVYTDESDSLGTVLMKDGNGLHRDYDNNFGKVGEGAVKDGKPDGVWKGIDEGMKLKYEETYANGVLVTGVSVGEKGDTIKYSKTRGVAAHYKGGLTAFYQYIARNVVYPDYERQNNIQGKVLLSFIVDKKGKVTEVKVLNSVSANIDNEAIRVLKASNAWMPATEYGRYVRVYYTIPMSFTLN